MSQTGILKNDEFIEFLVALYASLAIIYSLVIKDDASKYRNRPIINTQFDQKVPDHFHLTNMNVTDLRSGNIIASLPTFYARLKIGNEGTEALENVEVILEDVEPRPKKFMALNLSWAGYQVQNDIKREVRLSQGQYRPVDLIEVIDPKRAKDFAEFLRQIKNTDFERYDAYSKGFRTCTIKPTSYSDIFDAGSYIFSIGIYADNAEPRRIKVKVSYDGEWIDDDKIMRERHLTVKLFDH
ncbi:hypothetical protein A3E66_04510 [Candidatus Daviesbacteria bacterium RIFCSPHIGHO2_12_FULL_37_16]|uniref:Uncharacterized protein n=1 Tax=Candidatus Daviesbacteria bacterium RIFCSPHIGHO2_12_FULL_37_16 TaxID=1797778 RepID=A0A1F5K2C8_9BACT|nr:MAG: hypothetical protein A3E66_04510 [Candidatus Daviesbacteria bacterium RIFCSPHIGHO2_12_FULL_37_16]